MQKRIRRTLKSEPHTPIPTPTKFTRLLLKIATSEVTLKVNKKKLNPKQKLCKTLERRANMLSVGRKLDVHCVLFNALTLTRLAWWLGVLDVDSNRYNFFFSILLLFWNFYFFSAFFFLFSVLSFKHIYCTKYSQKYLREKKKYVEGWREVTT